MSPLLFCPDSWLIVGGVLAVCLLCECRQRLGSMVYISLPESVVETLIYSGFIVFSVNHSNHSVTTRMHYLSSLYF